MADKHIQQFTSPLGGELRVLTAEDGSLHFVAADVAKSLGYDTAARLVRMVEDYERGTHAVLTPGGPQQMSTITESGLYTAALRSRRPEAEPFKRWVTEELIPEARFTAMTLLIEARIGGEVAVRHHVYVVQLGKELTKVGITKRPVERMIALRSEAQAYGYEMTQYWVSRDPVPDARKIERKAMQHYETTREYIARPYDEVHGVVGSLLTTAGHIIGGDDD